jgi:hypothetical protein
MNLLFPVLGSCHFVLVISHRLRVSGRRPSDKRDSGCTNKGGRLGWPRIVSLSGQVRDTRARATPDAPALACHRPTCLVNCFVLLCCSLALPATSTQIHQKRESIDFKTLELDPRKLIDALRPDDSQGDIAKNKPAVGRSTRASGC